MKPEQLFEILDLQVDYWAPDFPHIKSMQNEILEMLKVEQEKFEETITRGEGMVKRIAAELKGKGTPAISESQLSELYDSHGLPPEIVKQIADRENVEVEIPENFYALIAKRHMQANKPEEEEKPKAEAILKTAVEGLPATEQLYYRDAYAKDFEARVIKVIPKGYVVLDKTCFYPEGGGQPADNGSLRFDHTVAKIVDVQKIGNVIVHKIDGKLPTDHKMVRGVLNWDKRYALMKAHTATHLINGASRRVLGEHVWQHGTQKSTEVSRLDISHYRRLTPEQVNDIETLANKAVEANMNVETTWMPRNEAEANYGFRLYQGGAVPGKDIRVVKTGDWDVEACAGTHLEKTGEVGFVKIVYTERIQDGVERIGYSVGLKALKAVQTQERILRRVSESLNAPVDKLDTTAEKLVKELKEANMERRKLTRELAAKETSDVARQESTVVEVDGIMLNKRNFEEPLDVERWVQTANEMIKRDDRVVVLFYGSDRKNARILIVAGNAAVKKGVNAGTAVREVSPLVGGGGGGRPNFAQGGGTQTDKISEAVQRAEEIIKKQLHH